MTSPVGEPRERSISPEELREWALDPDLGEQRRARALLAAAATIEYLEWLPDDFRHFLERERDAACRERVRNIRDRARAALERTDA